MFSISLCQYSSESKHIYFDVATEGCAGTVTYSARRDGSRHNLIQHISGTVAEVDISIAEDEVIPITVSATCDGHTITRQLRFRHQGAGVS